MARRKMFYIPTRDVAVCPKTGAEYAVVEVALGRERTHLTLHGGEIVGVAFRDIHAARAKWDALDAAREKYRAGLRDGLLTVNQVREFQGLPALAT